MPGFPVTPLIFVVLALLLLINTVYTTFWPSALGLAMTAAGAAVYLGFLRHRNAPPPGSVRVA